MNLFVEKIINPGRCPQLYPPILPSPPLGEKVPAGRMRGIGGTNTPRCLWFLQSAMNPHFPVVSVASAARTSWFKNILQKHDNWPRKNLAT